MQGLIRVMLAVCIISTLSSITTFKMLEYTVLDRGYSIIVVQKKDGEYLREQAEGRGARR